nr:acylneuraminate cytidylyltransferase [Anaerolineae bacterium]NIN96152.1 acylneuraminate cytidylyltransferase [Anaerolineae bacterium]
MNPNTVAIVQARVGSTRLPGKVLKDLVGLPLLARVVRRTARASRPDEVVVAIPEASTDDSLARLCHAYGWPCFRGSEDDVLDRYYRAATEYGAESVVRITSDCPLVDPGIVDQVVDLFLQGEWDYVSNTLAPRTYPRGLDVEVFTFDALRLAWKEDSNPAWREHVT